MENKKIFLCNETEHKENYSLTTRGHSSFCRVVSRALLFDTENIKTDHINIFIKPNQRPGALSRL